MVLQLDDKENLLVDMVESLKSVTVRPLLASDCSVSLVLQDGTYPLSSKDKPQSKKFRAGFVQLLRRIVAECCSQNIMFEDNFFDIVLQWLGALSRSLSCELLPVTEPSCHSSNARAIRHTATIATQAILIQLATVLQECFDNCEKFQNILEKEEKKAESSAKSTHVKELWDTATGKAEHLQSLLSWMFKRSFTLIDATLTDSLNILVSFWQCLFQSLPRSSTCYSRWRDFKHWPVYCCLS